MNYSFQIYNLINENKLEEAMTILNKNHINIKSKEYNSFKIRILLEDNKINTVRELFNQKDLKLMKRDYLLFISKNDDKNENINIFKYIIKNYNIINKDIDFLINNNLTYILLLLDGYYFKTNFKSNFNNFDNLRFYNFNNSDLEIISNKIINKFSGNTRFFDSIKKFNNFLDTNIYNIVIDGGNILFSKKTTKKDQIKRYKKLLKILQNTKIKKNKKLLVIHQRHFNTKNKEIIKIILEIKNLKNLLIYETPKNINDDYYILLASLKKKSKILTNDNFNDHIFEFGIEIENKNVFKNFLSDNIMKHQNYNIIQRSFSNCIQVNENIYIPTNEGSFYKY